MSKFYIHQSSKLNQVCKIEAHRRLSPIFKWIFLTSNTPEKLSFLDLHNVWNLWANCDPRPGVASYICLSWDIFLTYFGSHKNSRAHNLLQVKTFPRHSNLKVEFARKCQYFDCHLLLLIHYMSFCQFICHKIFAMKMCNCLEYFHIILGLGG